MRRIFEAVRSGTSDAAPATALTLAMVWILGCSDGPHAAREVTAPAALQAAASLGTGAAPDALAESAGDQGGINVIPLPVNQTYTGAGTAFRIANSVNSVSSHAGEFAITGGSGANALRAISNGTTYSLRATNSGSGAAGFFSSGANANPGLPAVQVQASGTNAALFVNNQNAGGTAAAFRHSTNSLGGGVSVVQSAGAGDAMRIDQFGTGFGFRVVVANTSSPSEGITVANNGVGDGLRVSQNGGNGRAAYFSVSTTGNGASTLLSQTFGSGWAGEFLASTANGKGVLITTQGGAGLQVVGGSKNAVVGTSSGARALYTEESTEVWFTEYGSATLGGRRTHVAFDRTFSETVNLTEAYHVFVQPYGDAELYVANRTARGFDVVLRDGAPNVEFSYRVVAKRRGFEHKRLERAPWADASVQRSTGLSRGQSR